MKITAIKTYLLQHPMTRPTGPSNFYYRTRTTLIIKIETDAGLSGWGETVAFSGIRDLIEQQYGAILIGRDPLAQRSLWASLRPCRSKVNSSSKSISHRVCFSRKSQGHTAVRPAPYRHSGAL